MTSTEKLSVKIICLPGRRLATCPDLLPTPWKRTTSKGTIPWDCISDSFQWCCGSGAGGVLIKLPPGPGAGSLKTWRNFLGKKAWLHQSTSESTQVKEGNFKVSNKTICDKKKCKNVRVGEAGAGAFIWIYGSAEPEPKEIFTAPHQCLPVTCSGTAWF